MRGGGEAVAFEGKLGVVEVKEVRLVGVEQVLDAEEPVVGELRVHRRNLFVPMAVVGFVERVRGGDGGDAVGHDKISAGVKLLRIEALPPFALAVGFGQVVCVVANAGEWALGVVVVGGLQPVPRVGGMVGDGDTQASLAGEFRVDADDVLLRADLYRVPVVEAGVVVVEVVVVIGERGKVFRSGRNVHVHQLVGLPVLGLPEIVDLHPADLGGMAVGLQVVVVLAIALDVHVAGVPVALLGHALRGPVVPDSELGVAEPVGRLIAGLERIPSWLEWTGGNVDAGGRLGQQTGSHPRSEGGRRCGGESGLQQAAAGEPGSGHARHHRRTHSG